MPEHYPITYQVRAGWGGTITLTDHVATAARDAMNALDGMTAIRSFHSDAGADEAEAALANAEKVKAVFARLLAAIWDDLNYNGFGKGHEETPEQMAQCVIGAITDNEPAFDAYKRDDYVPGAE